MLRHHCLKACIMLNCLLIFIVQKGDACKSWELVIK